MSGVRTIERRRLRGYRRGTALCIENPSSLLFLGATMGGRVFLPKEGPAVAGGMVIRGVVLVTRGPVLSAGDRRENVGMGLGTITAASRRGDARWAGHGSLPGAGAAAGVKVQPCEEMKSVSSKADVTAEGRCGSGSGHREFLALVSPDAKSGRGRGARAPRQTLGRVSCVVMYAIRIL